MKVLGLLYLMEEDGSFIFDQLQFTLLVEVVDCQDAFDFQLKSTCI